ncbi:MAG: glycosyltransferase family 2 protein, partial [Planctomycetales bacterium]|nr:glycosyltransferase family 2 protein [Planctomycetales bacterium]
MLTDWTYWLSSIPQASLWLLLSALLLFDAPRYLIGSMLVWYIDAWTSINPFRQRTVGTDGFTYCPSICVIVAGLNEARSLRRGLSAIWGTYPRLEIIVVDDGSNDGMSQVAHDFARNHADVRVVTKRRRGGKSSAMNAALPLTDAEVVVVLDADSELSPHALWEIVQPLADPRVAAVSGNVRVRNTHANVLTRVQCFEYLRSILLGR